MYIKNKTKFTSGLTLIETLIAITVLMSGVVLPMSIYSRSIEDARGSGNQTTAYYLAQDAIEFIKYKVNTEFNNNDSWFSTMPNCTAGNCTVDTKNGLICNGGSCSPVLFFDSALGLYTHDSLPPTASPSIFSREVKFKNSPTEQDGRSVSVTVYWSENGVSKDVELKEYMFDWR